MVAAWSRGNTQDFKKKIRPTKRNILSLVCRVNFRYVFRCERNEKFFNFYSFSRDLFFLFSCLSAYFQCHLPCWSVVCLQIDVVSEREFLFLRFHAVLGQWTFSSPFGQERRHRLVINLNLSNLFLLLLLLVFSFVTVAALPVRCLSTLVLSCCPSFRDISTHFLIRSFVRSFVRSFPNILPSLPGSSPPFVFIHHLKLSTCFDSLTCFCLLFRFRFPLHSLSQTRLWLPPRDFDLDYFSTIVRYIFPGFPGLAPTQHASLNAIWAQKEGTFKRLQSI